MDSNVGSESSVAGEDAVDALLRQDPMGAYADMDPRSRDDYRARVVSWAQRSGQSPTQVAHCVLVLARQAGERHGTADRRAHVGYLLSDRGVASLAAALKTRLNMQELIQTGSPRALLVMYCLLALLLSAGYGVLSVWAFKIALPWPGQLLLAIAVTVYAGYIVPGWFNMLALQRLQPRWMPRMDFRAGLPPSAKTLVVIPCLLTSREGIDALAQSLQRLYRNNRGANVGYALLSDFTDAATPQVEDDAGLLDEACARISLLNQQHGGGFMLFHRPRRWNPGEDRWMGWERKRGKLEELNAYLVGAASPFQTLHGDLDRAAGARYVLTLDDDDAELTKGAVCELAAVLSHPLNRAVLSADGRRIEAGFTIVQPRGMIALPSDAAPSRLENLLHSTLELESSEAERSEQPVVDVDQDLFGQAVYCGKGMYDVAAFHRLTQGLIAENTVLSHDVLEGGIVRSAVVTDIVLRETFTPTLDATIRRTHRWFRGDWQLLPWLSPWIRNASGAWVDNPLPWFGRWKIFHNLLRMLFSPASLMCFVVGWLTSPVPGWWTLNLLAIAWLPSLLRLVVGIARSLLSEADRTTLQGVSASLGMRSAAFIFGVENARTSLDAAARASFRMWVSHRRRLEWTASIIAFQGQGHGLLHYVRWMWTSPTFAALTVALVAALHPAALSSAIPFAVLWSLAPVIAWWWSQQVQQQDCSPRPTGS
ncbi:hypothetical protein [Xanthomonas maliensis]|uniref:hypothetical protein n=1 Tax=Xanthomonas maliensis TaxID=1321368 RepID=UPI0003A75C91|nr:hypothetical protein [Xanthomonas maliensis]KAB7766660.1 hypothetical protein CKY51_12760 [Xanthomonas maliensis]